MTRDREDFVRRNTANHGEYSITGTTHYPGQPAFIEFFDQDVNLIGHVDIIGRGLDPALPPRHVVVPRPENTEAQHRTLDKAVAKLRELSGEAGRKIEYTPITVQEIDLVQVVQGMSPDRAKGVLQILARTLEETLRTERTKEKK